eukprot:Hpha_TRINITY_DN16159_c1_g8::TRINITY_DN16159_c1_g8_i1::g.6236::m.6236
MGLSGSKYEGGELHDLMSFGAERQRDSLPSTVSVLVWNLQKQQDTRFEPAFRELVEGKDLLVLQEVHLRDKYGPEFFTATGHTYSFAPSFKYLAAGSFAGTTIASVAAPTWEGKQVTEEKEPIIGTPKSAVLAKYEVEQGASLLVVSVHGINRGSNEGFERQLDLIAGEIQKHQGAVILAGDFNTQSARKMDYLQNIARSCGLSPVEWCPDDRTVSKLSRRPLDHAFVRGGKVVAQRCRSSTIGSDHVALEFDFEFQRM